MPQVDLHEYRIEKWLENQNYYLNLKIFVR